MKPGDNSPTRLRRELLTQPGQWAVMRTSVQVTEAAARRLVRAYSHAKPSRLDPDATGNFFKPDPFQHQDTWARRRLLTNQLRSQNSPSRSC